MSVLILCFSLTMYVVFGRSAVFVNGLKVSTKERLKIEALVHVGHEFDPRISLSCFDVFPFSAA